MKSHASWKQESSLKQALDRASARIAPTWPLDRFIAVNPLWGFNEMALRDASSMLAALCGSRMLMPRRWYKERYADGSFGAPEIEAAIKERGEVMRRQEVEAVLDADDPVPSVRARFIDVTDAHWNLTTQPSWRDFVVQNISQHCATHFDNGQSQLPPTQAQGLYASWRDHAAIDRGPELLMGLPNFRELAKDLPTHPELAIALALAELDVAPQHQEPYLSSLLLDVGGWAAWCAYLRWQSRMAQSDDVNIVDLVAIRIAWEWLLFRAAEPVVLAQWQTAKRAWDKVDTATARAYDEDWILQRAVEIAYQKKLAGAFLEGKVEANQQRPSLQAVFCIDVRSEVMRRALEAQSESIRTLGFAGFFGLPAAYKPMGGDTLTPHLPGLLAPKFRVEDAGVNDGTAARRGQRLFEKNAWKQFQSAPASGFSFVEALGLLFGPKLVTDSMGLSRPAPSARDVGLLPSEDAQRKPRLVAHLDGTPLDATVTAQLAAGVLRSMSLTENFARLVLLVGHGSETVNNPHAAGLDCGACCGQTGEVSARAVAALLNDKSVRADLAEQGIVVPTDTHFAPALHNTTTDEVTLFDLDEMPNYLADDLKALRQWLHSAARNARRERSGKLGISMEDDDAIKKAITARARDWAQVRPEWGLADNAAFIAGPREHTRHMNLEGKSFLHEYRWQDDEGFRTLETIMTAPMVVAHWINFQYYASVVDNQRYGSGNKVLHNVVGGNIGVFEGNGGDLRIGLPLQSLHDGQRWVHTPRRLSVFIHAPRKAIEEVLAKHTLVKNLVEGEWLYLFAVGPEPGPCHRYANGSWQLFP